MTSFACDVVDRSTSTTAAPTTPNAATTSTGYDAASQVTSTTDAGGNVTQYGYDNAGRRTSVSNALNQVTVYTYDAASNQVTEIGSSFGTISWIAPRATKYAAPAMRNGIW